MDEQQLLDITVGEEHWQKDIGGKQSPLLEVCIFLKCQMISEQWEWWIIGKQ
jgi:hypothetical protein